MTQTTDAALVPEDVRALRVQNGALRTLNRCLEEEIKQHRAKAQEYHAATTTLDSEREANRILTDTIEAQARRIEALEGAGKRALAVLADLETNHPDCMGWAAPYPSTTPCIKLEADALRAALEPTP